MSSGDVDDILVGGGDGSQKSGAIDAGDSMVLGILEFRVAREDGGGVDHQVGCKVLGVLSVVSFIYADAAFAKGFCSFGRVHV